MADSALADRVELISLPSLYAKRQEKSCGIFAGNGIIIIGRKS